MRENADDNRQLSNIWSSRLWGVTAGLSLAVVRIVSGLKNPIADCDETYNYWEPLHYLSYGSGMQTWEYSPIYTLRSYSYLLPSKLLVKPLDLLFRCAKGRPDKIMTLYAARGALGLVCAVCEAKFVDGVVRRLGASIGALTFTLLLTSAGMFHMSTALLPSATATYVIMLTYAKWLTGRYRLATFLAVLTTLVFGWPFVALLFAPLALHILHAQIRQKDSLIHGLAIVLRWGIESLAIVTPAILLIDFYYYRRFAFPVLNILLYNVMSDSGAAGDQLYGVEPWTFYAHNLFLNLNVLLPLALLAPLALLLPFWPAWSWRTRAEIAVFLSSAYLWLVIMLLRPHKEERFLFPIYPILILAAALTLDGIRSGSQELKLWLLSSSNNTKKGTMGLPEP